MWWEGGVFWWVQRFAEVVGGGVGGWESVGQSPGSFNPHGSPDRTFRRACPMRWCREPCMLQPQIKRPLFYHVVLSTSKRLSLFYHVNSNAQMWTPLFYHFFTMLKPVENKQTTFRPLVHHYFIEIMMKKWYKSGRRFPALQCVPLLYHCFISISPK